MAAVLATLCPAAALELMHRLAEAECSIAACADCKLRLTNFEQCASGQLGLPG